TGPKDWFTLGPYNRELSMRTRLVRLIMLVVIWWMTGWAMYSIWPYEPRMKLGKTGELTVGGITPDGGKLVTFAMRARRYRMDDGQQVIAGMQSGPIQIWDLKRGDCRTVDLPGQSSAEPYIKCIDGVSRKLDSSGWNIGFDQNMCRNEWYLCTMHYRQMTK